MNYSIKFGIFLICVMSTGTFPFPSGAYEEDTGVGGVMVKGQVTFKGNIPKLPPFQVNRDKSYCGESMPDESILIEEQSKGLSNIVVNLKGPAKGKAFAKKAPLKIDNRSCRFLPQVSLGVTDSVLEIASADPVLHNTHILQKDETVLNVALPPKGRTIRKTLSQPGRLNVRCDAHNFMRASIHIFDHPYFTSTDVTGSFELSQVPQGTHTLQFWHQTLGMKELSITVKKDTPLVVNVSFP